MNKTNSVSPSQKHSNRNSKWKSRVDTMREVVNEQIKREHDMMFRHPWFNLVYNWVVVVSVVALFISFGIWGENIRTERKAAALTATAMAEYQSEQNAIEQAKQQELAAIAASEASVMKNEANDIAKVLYGVKNFIEKYHYTEDDLMTLARCIFNRVESKSYSNDIHAVVNQEQQWVGYYENNPVVDQYYKIAYNAVNEWHHEETKPIANDFVFAELTPNGIWLKNDIHADGYARRWRYGQ